MTSIKSPVTGLPVWQVDPVTGSSLQNGRVTSGDGLVLTATASPTPPTSGDLLISTPDGTTLVFTAANGQPVAQSTTGTAAFTSATGPVVSATGTTNGEDLFAAMGNDATSIALSAIASGAGDSFDRFRLTCDGSMAIGPGSGARDTVVGRSQAGVFSVTTGSFSVTTVGKGLAVKEGSNAKQGTATLVAGSVVVGNTSVTANSRILLTSQADGGTPGFLRVSTRTAGTSFTITSSSGTDTSVVAYQIFEPA